MLTRCGVLCLGVLIMLGVVTPALASHTHVQLVGRGGLAPRAIQVLTASGEVVSIGEAVELPEFREALVSWNAIVPPRASAALDIRVSRAGASWSPWMTITSWSGSALAPEVSWSAPEFEGGKVAIDYFVSEETWTRLQWRARVVSTDLVSAVRIARVDVTVTGDDASTTDARAVGDRVTLDVPFYTQRAERPEIAARVCSPTSVAMVLAFHDRASSVTRAAETIYDARHDLYGNWPRAVQGAFALGVEGHLARYDNWGDVRATLERGAPMIASIRVKEGELPQAPYDTTAGHLIVITGLDGHGGVLVNDPAADSEPEGRLVYPMDAMEVVWWGGSRGTAYVLTGAHTD